MSQLGLYFLNAKKAKSCHEDRVSVESAGHGRSIASDNMSDNSDHSGERLGQNGDNENVYLHGLKMRLRCVARCVCTVCVNITNEALFFNGFPFEN